MLGGTTLVFVVMPSTEPSAQGKVASRWVKEALEASDESTRSTAVMALVECGPRANPIVIEALDEAGLANEAPRQVLLQMGSNAVPILVHALRSSDWDVRLAAIEILQDIGPEASAALAALLKAASEDPRIRLAAISTFQTLNATPQDAVPILVEALNDGASGVRWQASEVLRDYGPRAKDAIPFLVEQLGRPQSCRQAAYALETIDPEGEETIRGLIEALSHVETQQFAIKNLGNLGSQAKLAWPGLLLIATSDSSLRSEAIKALQRIGSPAADQLQSIIEQLMAAPRYDDVVPALGQIGPEAVPLVPGLVQLLTEVNSLPYQRVMAAKILGTMGSFAKDGTTGLGKALSDEHLEVRRAAAEALQQIGPASIPALIECLKGPDPGVMAYASSGRGYFTEVLAVPSTYGDWHLTQPPHQYLKSELAGTVLQSFGEASVAPLTSALRDADNLVRIKAAGILGYLGVDATAALTTLRHGFADTDFSVRRAFRQAATKIDPNLRNRTIYVGTVAAGEHTRDIVSIQKGLVSADGARMATVVVGTEETVFVDVKQQLATAKKETKTDAGVCRLDFGRWFQDPLTLVRECPMALSPQGSQLAVATTMVLLADTTTGEKLLTLDLPDQSVASAISFSWDGQLIAVGWQKEKGEGAVTIWNARNGDEIMTIAGGGQAVAFSADRKLIASVGVTRDNTKVWELATGKELWTFAGGGNTLMFSPDSRRLASDGGAPWNDAGVLKVWDLINGEQVLAIHTPHEVASCVAFSADGSLLAYGTADLSQGGDGGVRIVDSVSGQEHFTFIDDCQWVTTLSFSPDSTQLLAVDRHFRFITWDVRAER